MDYKTVTIPGILLNIPHSQSGSTQSSRMQYMYNINLSNLEQFKESIEKITSEYQYIVLTFVESSSGSLSESVYDVQLRFYNDQHEAQLQTESIKSLFSTTPHDSVLSGLLKTYFDGINKYLH